MWIGTHIGIKGFPEFHVHVGNMNIKRSVGLSRPLEYLDAGGLLMLFIAYGSVSQWLLYDQWGEIHIDLSKSLLICTEKEELENILQNVFCSMQLANVKWRQLRIDKNLSKRYTYKLHVIM